MADVTMNCVNPVDGDGAFAESGRPCYANGVPVKSGPDTNTEGEAIDADQVAGADGEPEVINADQVAGADGGPEVIEHDAGTESEHGDACQVHRCDCPGEALQSLIKELPGVGDVDRLLTLKRSHVRMFWGDYYRSIYLSAIALNCAMEDFPDDYAFTEICDEDELFSEELMEHLFDLGVVYVEQLCYIGKKDVPKYWPEEELCFFPAASAAFREWRESQSMLRMMIKAPLASPKSSD